MGKKSTVCRYEHLVGNEQSEVSNLRAIHVDALSESLLELSNRRVRASLAFFAHALTHFNAKLVLLRNRNSSMNHTGQCPTLYF
jgi:hypothetical protein